MHDPEHTKEVIEGKFTETGRLLLEAIALDKVSTEAVEKIARDYREELVQLFGTDLISEEFYARWDRIMSGLHQPDDEEMKQMRRAEEHYPPLAA